MACSGRYATAEQFAEYWCNDPMLTLEEQVVIEATLDRTAGAIHAARAATGGCDCTLASWAAEHLRFLNIIMAAVFHKCPCARVNLTDAEKASWLQYAQGELLAIRKGELELCDGYTAADFPALADAERTWTPWRAEEIVRDTALRED